MTARLDLPVASDGRDALELADAVVREAGALVREAARGTHAITNFKGRNNVVTATDRASEALIIERVLAAFPGHRVLAEESYPNTDWREGAVWVIDPIDGTRNFAAGIPLYCVNLALAIDGEVVLGATYDPNRDTCFLGAPGRGLTVNGEPAHASGATELASCIVGTDLGYDDARAVKQLELLPGLWGDVQGLRIIASAALGLAWSAAGLLDVFAHSHLYPWDIGAALALVPAAGGRITDRDGQPATLGSESVVAGGSAAVEAFLRRVEGVAWR